MLLMHGELNQAFRAADAIDFDDALGLVEIGLDVTFADAQLASGRVGMTQAPTQGGSPGSTPSGAAAARALVALGDDGAQAGALWRG